MSSPLCFQLPWPSYSLTCGGLINNVHHTVLCSSTSELHSASFLLLHMLFLHQGPSTSPSQASILIDPSNLRALLLGSFPRHVARHGLRDLLCSPSEPCTPSQHTLQSTSAIYPISLESQLVNQGPCLFLHCDTPST